MFFGTLPDADDADAAAFVAAVSAADCAACAAAAFAAPDVADSADTAMVDNPPARSLTVPCWATNLTRPFESDRIVDELIPVNSSNTVNGASVVGLTTVTVPPRRTRTLPAKVVPHHHKVEVVVGHQEEPPCLSSITYAVWEARG